MKTSTLFRILGDDTTPGRVVIESFQGRRGPDGVTLLKQDGQTVWTEDPVYTSIAEAHAGGLANVEARIAALQEELRRWEAIRTTLKSTPPEALPTQVLDQGEEAFKL